MVTLLLRVDTVSIPGETTYSNDVTYSTKTDKAVGVAYVSGSVQLNDDKILSASLGTR